MPAPGRRRWICHSQSRSWIWEQVSQPEEAESTGASSCPEPQARVANGFYSLLQSCVTLGHSGRSSLLPPLPQQSCSVWSDPFPQLRAQFGASSVHKLLVCSSAHQQWPREGSPSDVPRLNASLSSLPQTLCELPKLSQVPAPLHLRIGQGHPRHASPCSRRKGRTPPGLSCPPCPSLRTLTT